MKITVAKTFSVTNTLRILLRISRNSLNGAYLIKNLLLKQFLFKIGNGVR